MNSSHDYVVVPCGHSAANATTAEIMVCLLSSAHAYLLCLNSHLVVVFITWTHSPDDLTSAARFLQFLILLCTALLLRNQFLRLHLLRVLYCGCFAAWFTTRIMDCVTSVGGSTMQQVIWRFSESVSALHECCCYVLRSL